MSTDKQTALQPTSRQQAARDIPEAITDHRHLLVPIKLSGQAAHAASYARKLRRQGISVQVSLLHVAPGGESFREYDASNRPPDDEYRARLLLTEAAALIVSENIAIGSLVRYGDIVFTILDVAEQLDCHEIVMPAAASLFRPVFMFDGIGARLARRQRSVPIVTVDRQGVPTRTASLFSAFLRAARLPRGAAGAQSAAHTGAAIAFSQPMSVRFRESASGRPSPAGCSPELSFPRPVSAPDAKA